MFKNFIDFCFSGLETDMERLFAIILVVFVLEMFTAIIVSVLDSAKEGVRR